MTKKDIKSKSEQSAEAAFMALFVIVSAAGSLHMLGFISITEQAQSIVGYALGAFSLIALGFIAWKSAVR